MMLKYTDFQKALESLSFRNDEYKAVIQESDIDVPYLVYLKTESNSLIADSVVYFPLITITADLVVDNLHDKHIQEVETLFKENEISFSKSIEFSESNLLYEILYTFTLIDE